MNKRNISVLDLINTTICEKNNEYIANMYIKIKSIFEQLANTGQLNSGAKYIIINNEFVTGLKNHFSEAFSYIRELQDELNIKYTDMELKKIEELLQNTYKDILGNQHEIRCGMSGDGKQVDYDWNEMPSAKFITDEINKIRLKNKLKKMTINDAYVIRNFRLSAIGIGLTFLISIVSLVISIYK